MTELEKAIMSDDETEDIHTEEDMIPDDDVYEEVEKCTETAKRQLPPPQKFHIQKSR